MNNRELASKLDMIALGNGWSGEALYDAERHPAASFGDRIVIRRFQHGIAKGVDHIALQDIAIKIRSHK